MSVPNLVLAGIACPAVIFGANMLLFRRLDKRNDGDDWRIDQRALTQSSRASPRVLLAFRTSMLVLGVSVLIHEMVTTPKPTALHIFRFFTVVSYSLLIAFFALGTRLSIHAVQQEQEQDKLDDVDEVPEPLPIRGRVFAAMQEVCFPTSLFIALVVWIQLVPGLYPDAPPREETLGFTSIAEHAVNVFMLAAEVALNDVPLRVKHAPLTMAWGALFVFYHGIIMAVERALAKPLSPSYPFLSPADNFLTLNLLVLLVALAGFHLLGCKIALLLRWVFSRKK